MSSPKTDRKAVKQSPKLNKDQSSSTSDTDERDRLRDIIVVIIAYPLTPTKRADSVGKNYPWLEVVSLVLKAALAAYAIYKGAEPGDW